MARSIGSRTIDGAAALRCMVVALPREQVEACRRAILPVEIVERDDVAEACASMSTVLPLVVVIDAATPDVERTMLGEMATACGAEIVWLDALLVGKAFAERLLEALRIAERRRLGIR
jgi:hypothetical protein